VGSDIDIGTNNIRLNSYILISEEFRYRHQLPFRYRTKSISDIPISKIYRSFPHDPSKWMWHIIFLTDFELHIGILPLLYKDLRILMSDIGYQTKFIPISDIMSDYVLFSPISDVPISGSVRYRWSRMLDWVMWWVASIPSLISSRLVFSPHRSIRGKGHRKGAICRIYN
jgi:hypothetical protein